MIASDPCAALDGSYGDPVVTAYVTRVPDMYFASEPSTDRASCDAMTEALIRSRDTFERRPVIVSTHRFPKWIIDLTLADRSQLRLALIGGPREGIEVDGCGIIKDRKPFLEAMSRRADQPDR